MYRPKWRRNALAYVAITRAKEELYIFHAESRMIFGMTNRNRVSRFVEEIPETLVEHTRSRDYSARPVSMPSFGGAKPFGEAPKTKSVAEAGGFTPKPRVKPAPAGTYRVGDTVLHKAFGTGSHRFRHADGERYATRSRI